MPPNRVFHPSVITNMSSLPLRALLRITAVALFSLPVAVSAHAQTYTFASASPFVSSALLTPGGWTLAVTGGAWNQVSGAVSGCNAFGSNCYVGWLTQFSYRLNGGAWLDDGYTGSYSTPALALANASPPLTLTVATNATLEVTLRDSYYLDNLGTLDVTLAPVTVTPEPASIVLLASGLFCVGLWARRRIRVPRT